MDDNALGSGSPVGWRSSVRVPFVIGDISPQRHQMVRDLVQHALSRETAYEAEVVLAELVTNAWQHGEPLDDDTLDVCWGAWDGLVHIQVTDGGAATVPAAAAAPTGGQRGRGLTIVAALSSSWGVRTEPAMTTVWATLPERRPAA